MPDDKTLTPYEKRDINVKRNQEAMDTHRDQTHRVFHDALVKRADEVLDGYDPE